MRFPILFDSDRRFNNGSLHVCFVIYSPSIKALEERSRREIKAPLEQTEIYIYVCVCVSTYKEKRVKGYQCPEKF